MSFPTSLPPPGSANSSSTLAGAGHTALHNNDANDTRAIAVKVGTGSSTSAANTVLKGTGPGTSGWAAVDAANDVTGVLATSHGGTGTTSTTGTGGVVFSVGPTISAPTLTGGGLWSGGPTINQPTITDFSNSNHDHSSAPQGGGLGSNTVGTSQISNGAVTSAKLGQAIGCRLHRTTLQSVSTSTETMASFDTEVFDTDTMIDISGNPTRITFTTAGVYVLTACVRWAASAAGRRVLAFDFNANGAGGLNRLNISDITASGNATGQVISTIYPFAAGDYVELEMYQDSGGTLNAGGTSSAMTMSAVRVGSAT